MHPFTRRTTLVFNLLCGLSLLLIAPSLRADALGDWNTRVGEVTVAAKLTTPQAARTAALVQTATFEAVNAITHRYKRNAQRQASGDASIDAAIAAANRAVLSQLVPAQQPLIETAYQAALSAIADGAPKTRGISVGEAAAATVLSARANDGADTVETYRPHTTPGVYAPTTVPLVPQWPARKPWAMTSAAQFRPGPPPALDSKRWASDFNESKDFGAQNSTARNAEQTSIAKFWETTNPVVYFQVVRSVIDSGGRDVTHNVVRSVIDSGGRDVTHNARLLALAAEAIDDALIAVFDGKYAYNFWRPITAIRNGDTDSNEATKRDASWLPFIETPMHPEYPCAHCTVSAAVSAVLESETGAAPSSQLRTTSPTLPGVERKWSDYAAFVAEVSNARVWAGVHYRTSAEVGVALGRKVGLNVANKALRSLE